MLTSGYKADFNPHIHVLAADGAFDADGSFNDTAVIRRILTHLGLWAPQVEAQRGPGPPAPDPPEASAPILTYHPVPDIA